LELDKTASIENIKETYKKLALVHHPNKGRDAEKFKK
jgi:DnaJ-class molecular chaperone